MSNGLQVPELVGGVDASDDYRVLRRLNIQEGSCSSNGDEETAVGIVVDVETTGLDHQRHGIIELAMRRFRYDARGVITKVDRPYSWLEDPWEPLDPKIVALTGLTESDLCGKKIDDATAIALLKSAGLVVAHNAGFDRKFVEKRLPTCAGMAWACSMREVDWAARGLEGRALGWLLSQCGWFHGAHRAANDVDAVIAVLRHREASGDTAFAELLATASTSGWIFRAIGAHFDVKEALKARGYRWDPEEAVWYREVASSERPAEEEWLSANVYAPCHRAKVDGPSVREITWHERHA